MNKSEAIREYLTANPRALPKQVVAALAEKGVEVSAALVSQIKHKRKARKHRPDLDGRGPTYKELLAVKKLADAVGGIENAKQALDLLLKLLAK